MKRRSWMAAVVLSTGLLLSAAATAGADGTSGVDTAYLKIETIRQNFLAAQRQARLNENITDMSEVVAGLPAEWLRPVSHEKVNMVTNRLAGEEPVALEVEGRVYYVPRGGYELAFMKNRSLRYATDPVGGERVDKAMARTYADPSGRVYYFSSESSFEDFLARAGKGPFYGVR